MKKLLLLLTMALVQPSANATIVDLTINFDAYPGDVSWALADSSGSSTIATGGSYGSAYASSSVVVPFDLVPDDYTFTIADSYGDGICCVEGAGSYTLSTGSLVLYSSNGQYGAGESIVFSVPPPVLDLTLNFDSYASDVEWNIIESASGNIVATGGGYDSSYNNTTLALPLLLGPNDYLFSITDSYGDGICCAEGLGSYSLALGATILYESDGQYGFGESVPFTIPASPVPVPASAWWFGSALLGLAGVGRKRSKISIKGV